MSMEHCSLCSLRCNITKHLQLSVYIGKMICSNHTANSAPVITGLMEVYVSAGQTFTGSYFVSDEDDIITAFELKV